MCSLHHPVPLITAVCPRVRQHEGVRPLWLTTNMKGQITHSCFARDWHRLSPSIFITPLSHTLLHSFNLLLRPISTSLQSCHSLTAEIFTTLSYPVICPVFSFCLPHAPHPRPASSSLALHENLCSVYHICSAV